MTIVRDKLEAALTNAMEVNPIAAITEALQYLNALEADARRWRALRYAAVHHDERFFEAMAAEPVAGEHPTDAEVDAAGDRAIVAMSL